MPVDKQTGRVNYLIGNDPKHWIRDGSTYRRVQYKSVYSKTDIVWYGHNGGIEYDLVLQPGADPATIGLHLDGARSLAIKDGAVQIQMNDGALSLQPPVVYQEQNGVRHTIACQYVLHANNEVRFRLDSYDRSKPVVIDPYLRYATYFGNANGGTIGTDQRGNVYLISGAQTYVPVTRDAQPQFAGNRRMSVAKFNPEGKLIYATYVGGDNEFTTVGGVTYFPALYDNLTATAVGQDGTVLLAGNNTGTNFPFTTPPTPTPGSIGFVLKLNSEGDGFDFVLPLEGVYPTVAAIDSKGNSYVAGTGPLPPTAGAYNAQSTPWLSGNFVAGYSRNGSVLYVADLPAAGQPAAATTDESGALYLAGNWQLGMLPTFGTSVPGTVQATDPDSFYLYICRLAASGASVDWASFLGAGPSSGSVAAIARDPASGLLYLTGNAWGTGLPTTPGSFQPSAAGTNQGNGFIASIRPDGMSFPAISYLNGIAGDYGQPIGLAVTANGVVVAAPLVAPGIPLKSPLQGTLPSSLVTFATSQNGGKSWSSSSSGQVMTSIWVDPKNPAVLLAVTQSGMQRSSDYGSTWTTVFNQQPYDLTMSPDGSSLYTCDYSNGLYKSTDEGASWTLITTTPAYSMPGYGFQAEVISVNPLNPQDIIIVTSFTNAVAQSLDGGVTFSVVSSSSPVPYFWDPWFRSYTDANGDIVVASYSSGLFRSTDRGKTWTVAQTPLAYISAVAEAPGKPATLYAAISPHGLYRSKDFGMTWTKVSSDSTYISGIVVAATDPNTLFFTDANGNVFKSVDGGGTARVTGVGPDVNGVLAFAMDPANSSRLYLGNYTSPVSLVVKLNKALSGLVWSTYYGSALSTALQSAASAPGDTSVWVGGYTDGYAPLPQAEAQGNGAFVLAQISDATPHCEFILNPQSQYVYNTQTVFAAAAAPSGCQWDANSDSSWINITHNESGEGSVTVNAQVVANSTSQTRKGHLTIAGQTLTITEPAANCTFEVPAQFSAPAVGGDVQISVQTGPHCAWDVENASPALAVVSGSSGVGNGTVTIHVDPSADGRSGETVVIADQLVTLQP